MKKLILLATLGLTLGAFAQVQKVETNEPKNINYVNNEARAEVYADYAEIKFFDRRSEVGVTLALTRQEFDELGKLLTRYDVKDKEYFELDTKRARIAIRFIERYGYVQSKITITINGVLYYWPDMNRAQFRRLFKA